jgi:hypothetical protein
MRTVARSTLILLVAVVWLTCSTSTAAPDPTSEGENAQATGEAPCLDGKVLHGEFQSCNCGDHDGSQVC